MGTATQLDVLDRRLPAGATRPHVVELEEPALATVMPTRRDKRTPCLVASGDGAFHLRGHVRRSVRMRLADRARIGGGGELPLAEVQHQLDQRAVEYLGDVATRNRMTEEILSFA